MNKVEKRLLIVEDDDSLYEAMVITFEQEIQNRQAELDGANISIVDIRARNLYEAKLELNDSNPDVVSVDMQFPKRQGEIPERDAGAELLAHIKRHWPEMPTILYSSSEAQQINRFLANHDVQGFAKLIMKFPIRGHGEWAKNCLDRLITA